MDVKDEASLFDALDTHVRGTLDLEQMKLFCQDVFERDLPTPQLEGILKRHCGDTMLCPRSSFLPVVREMGVRCRAIEQLQWDFALLDTKRHGNIPVRDAEILFMGSLDMMEQHKAHELWTEVIARREEGDADFNLEEMKGVLCDAIALALCEGDDVASLRDRLEEASTPFVRTDALLG